MQVAIIHYSLHTRLKIDITVLDGLEQIVLRSFVPMESHGSPILRATTQLILRLQPNAVALVFAIGLQVSLSQRLRLIHLEDMAGL